MSMTGNAAHRHPWTVTRSVWYAMFLREAIARTMTDRLGWFWMVAEPVFFTLIMVAIRSFIRGDALIVGAPFIPWMVVGLMGFFLVREGMMRGLGAVKANQALFAYRQVRPVDPVLVRNALEGLLRSLVFLLFIFGGMLLKVEALAPDDALVALAWWLSLWLLGLALGLIVSVLGHARRRGGDRVADDDHAIAGPFWRHLPDPSHASLDAGVPVAQSRCAWSGATTWWIF